MFGSPSVQATALLLSAGLAAWSAVIARSLRAAPGSAAFAWQMAAVALWCLLATLHLLVDQAAARIVVAKVLYLSMAPVPGLWLLFASDHARAEWPADRRLRVVIFLLPAATLIAAVTNDSHHLLWTAVTRTQVPGGEQLVYSSRAWFWIHAAYSYALFALGTVALVRGVRSFPPPHHRQVWAIGAGLALMWLALAVGLSGQVTAPEFALSPIALAVSGALLAGGLYRHRLFGLVPVARDRVLDSMEDGVLVLDPHRRIVDMNLAAERHTGTTLASLGRPIHEVAPWWTAALAEVRHSGGQPAVVRIEPGPRFFEVNVSPVRHGQRRFAGWLVMIRDVSTRRRLEAERYALSRRVQEQQKAESLTVLAAGVAHDFNNLLTGVLGNADLLAMQAPPGSAQRRTAEAIVASSQRAADLVSKMLAYAGEGRAVSERMDLDALVQETVELLRGAVAAHCTLRYDSPGPLPPIDADPMQVRQVVTNLIINAAEAVFEGGLITVLTGQETLARQDLQQMTFGLDADPGRYVFIDVVDNGPGMSEETLARIFDPFYSTKETGRGLGLPAVRGIVRSHQSALRVTSARGQGTRFRVWLSLTPGRGRRG